MAKAPKRPRDPSQLAKAIVDIATGAASEAPYVPAGSKPRGREGAAARAARLTPEQRADIARTAAAARWKKGAG